MENQKYDAFIAKVDGFTDREKGLISDAWSNGGEVSSTLGSAVWTTIRVSGGMGFKERAIRFLNQLGVDDPQSELDDFVEQF
jgi:hypothetical protein